MDTFVVDLGAIRWHHSWFSLAARSRALNTTSVSVAQHGEGGGAAPGAVFVLNEATDNGLWGPGET